MNNAPDWETVFEVMLALKRKDHYYVDAIDLLISEIETMPTLRKREKGLLIGMLGSLSTRPPDSQEKILKFIDKRLLRIKEYVDYANDAIFEIMSQP